jgi:hypothetical protein
MKSKSTEPEVPDLHWARTQIDSPLRLGNVGSRKYEIVLKQEWQDSPEIGVRIPARREKYCQIYFCIFIS